MNEAGTDPRRRQIGLDPPEAVRIEPCRLRERDGEAAALKAGRGRRRSLVLRMRLGAVLVRCELGEGVGVPRERRAGGGRDGDERPRQSVLGARLDEVAELSRDRHGEHRVPGPELERAQQAAQDAPEVRPPLERGDPHGDAGVVGRATARDEDALGACEGRGRGIESRRPGVPRGGPRSRRWAGVWGGAVVTLVNVFDPELVLRGGGAAAAGELLLEPRTRVVRRRTLAPGRYCVRIELARLGPDAGLVGAAAPAPEAAA